MTSDPDPLSAPQKPTPASGLARIAAAAGYSIAGARRLWREAASGQEVMAGLTVVIVVPPARPLLRAG